jgi:hypothetical protein
MRTLIQKEILDHLLSLRFLILSGIGALVIWLSLFDGYSYYQDRLKDYRTAQTVFEERFTQLQSDGGFLELGNIGFENHKPPAPLAMFVRGLEPIQGRSISNAGSVQRRLRRSPSEVEPILGVFPPLDLGLVIQTVIGLFALLLTYDGFCGEKSGGTLRLMDSFSVPRYRLIIAKCLGALIPALISFGLPLLVGITILTLMPDVQLIGSEWARLAFILLAFLAYISVFAAAGLLCSCLTHRPATSFVLCLTFWTASVVIVPRVTLILSDWIRPAPSIHEHQAKLFQVQAGHFAEWQRVRAEWVTHYETQHGEVPWETPTGGVEYRKMHISTRNDYRDAMQPEVTRLEEEFRNRYRNRLDLATMLGSISPTFALKNATTTLSGTAIPDHQRFEDAFIQNHLKAYGPWVSSFADRISFYRADPNNYEEVKWDISDMPLLAYDKPDPRIALEAGLVNTGWLAIWGIVFIVLVSMRMVHYDVR